LQDWFLIPNACSLSSNARTKRNNAEAHNKQAAIIFLVDELRITQEKKRNGTSKEEESDAVASRLNRRKGKKNVTFSLRFHFLQKKFFWGFKVYNSSFSYSFSS
jgi:hypothetical protein